PFSVGGLQWLFLISALGRLGSLVLLWRVAEPRAQSIGHVVRVLQRLSVMRPASWLPLASLGWSFKGARRRAVAPIAGRISPAPASAVPQPLVAEATPATLSAA